MSHFEKAVNDLHVLKAISNPDGLNFFVGKKLSPEQDPERFALAIANEDKVHRLTALVGLSNCQKTLSIDQRIGVILFVGLVYHADDALDKQTEPLTFQNGRQLQEYLMAKKTIVGKEEITLGEFTATTLKQFQDNKGKQDIINKFLETMCQTQVQKGNKKPAGTYRFEDALAYKRETNFAFVSAIFQLAGKDPESAPSLPHAGVAMQMIDDIKDWFVDKNENTENLWLGMAQTQGEIEFLDRPEAQTLGRSVARRPEMAKTRKAYRQAFLDAVDTPKQFLFRRAFKLYSRRFF